MGGVCAHHEWCWCSASLTPPHRACPAPQYSWDYLVLPTNPSAKAKISTEEAKQILSCPSKPSSGTYQVKFPQCSEMGTQPFIPKSDLHKMWGVLKSQKHLYFCPYCSGWCCSLGCILGWDFKPRADVQQESMPDTGTSHQAELAAVLGVPGHGEAKGAANNQNNHDTAREPWLGLAVLSQREKNEVEKSHWALQRGLGFTVISGEFRSMRSCNQILSQLIIKHPLHTTKSRHVVHILFNLTHTAMLELLHKSIITYGIFFSSFF